MLPLRAAALFLSTFLLFAGLSHALPGLPRLAGDAWRAVSHHQGPKRVAGGVDALALYADGFGHFGVDARLGDAPVRLLVDSGASYVGLTSEDAARIGLDPAPEDFTIEVGTANGALRLAPIVIPELTLGHITLKDVPATVSPAGALHASLLGMTALSRFSRVELAGARMLLVP